MLSSVSWVNWRVSERVIELEVVWGMERGLEIPLFWRFKILLWRLEKELVWTFGRLFDSVFCRLEGWKWMPCDSMLEMLWVEGWMFCEDDIIMFWALCWMFCNKLCWMFWRFCWKFWIELDDWRFCWRGCEFWVFWVDIWVRKSCKLWLEDCEVIWAGGNLGLILLAIERRLWGIAFAERIFWDIFNEFWGALLAAVTLARLFWYSVIRPSMTPLSMTGALFTSLSSLSLASSSRTK